MCLCFTGHRLALHRTQVPDRLALAAALPLSARTPATLPSIAPSAAAALGIQVFVSCCSRNAKSTLSLAYFQTSKTGKI